MYSVLYKKLVLQCMYSFIFICLLRHTADHRGDPISGAVLAGH